MKFLHLFSWGAKRGSEKNPGIVGIIVVNNTRCNLFLFPTKLASLQSAVSFPNYVTTFLVLGNKDPLFSGNTKLSALRRKIERFYTGLTLSYLGYRCECQGYEMRDVVFSNYCLWSHLVWNKLCLCEMTCYFQSVPFYKLALYRKGSLIILYMILICISRKCPSLCLLKGVCFIICSLLEHFPHYLSGLSLPFLSVWMFPFASRKGSHKEINVLNKTCCWVFFIFWNTFSCHKLNKN